MSDLVLRSAAPEDAAALLRIYRPVVERTTTSFELEPPSTVELAARIERCLQTHAWLVADTAGGAVGYAYGSAHRARAAYQWTTEVSAYVAPDRHRRGVGRLLYERLFEALAARGYCNALAGITLPNEPSTRFHAALGFTRVGVYRAIGFKHGAWRDVAWYERRLRSGSPPDLR